MVWGAALLSLSFPDLLVRRDRHTDTHRYTHTHTHTHRQKDRQTDRQTDTHTHTLTFIMLIDILENNISFLCGSLVLLVWTSRDIYFGFHRQVFHAL